MPLCKQMFYQKPRFFVSAWKSNYDHAHVSKGSLIVQTSHQDAFTHTHKSMMEVDAIIKYYYENCWFNERLYVHGFENLQWSLISIMKLFIENAFIIISPRPFVWHFYILSAINYVPISTTTEHTHLLILVRWKPINGWKVYLFCVCVWYKIAAVKYQSITTNVRKIYHRFHSQYYWTPYFQYYSVLCVCICVSVILSITWLKPISIYI